VIGGGLLRASARIGLTTCEDAVDLATVFAQVARRQVRDALATARRRAASRARRPT
jgi:hypothetical protein